MAELGEEEKFEEYNYDADKYMPGGGSGKGRTRKEAEEHTNRTDPGGHTRKTTQKLINSHEKEKEKQLKTSSTAAAKHHHHHEDDAKTSKGPDGEGAKKTSDAHD
jgi:nuclear protein 1